MTVGVHATAALLLLLSSVFITSGVWTAVATYCLLGLAVVVAAIGPDLATQSRIRGDLLALVAGGAGLVVGLIVLVEPAQFDKSTGDTIRPFLAWYGLGFVLTSLALIAVEFHPLQNQAVNRGVHLLSGGLFLAFMVMSIWPSPTGVALYAVFGLTLILRPWLTHRLPVVDPSSLRARAAFMLVAIAAIPLIGTVAIIADQAGQLARQQALAQQQTLAVALATNADDYIRLHRAAIAGLASLPGLSQLAPEASHNLLADFSVGYPDVVAFSVFDVDGAPLSRSDNRLLQNTAGYPVYDDARRSNGPSLQILISTLIHVPIFAFGAPIKDAGGTFAGIVVEALESTQLAERITYASGGKDMVAYLVDAQGHVMAHPKAELVASLADLSATPSVAAFLDDSARSGTLTYSAADGEQLAAYASATELGWGVIVERPATLALASMRSAREHAFDVLLAFVCLAALAAAFSTGWLTRPLAVLADAAQRHSLGDHLAPLPRSGLTEIAQLSSCFGLMREDVLARTAERDRAGLELRESEARLRKLMDGVPVGVLVVDSAGRPYYANPAARRLLAPPTDLAPDPDIQLDTLMHTSQPYFSGTDRMYAADETPSRAPALAIASPTTISSYDLRAASGYCSKSAPVRFSTTAARSSSPWPPSPISRTASGSKRNCGWPATRRSTHRAPRVLSWPP